MKKKLCVLTGAGISAESGISTFRDSNGLWENHNVYDVAHPDGFRKNPELVLEFYNQRRRQVQQVQPNKGHLDIANIQQVFNVAVITQNVDDLHERAGTKNIIHLHGELLKVRSTADPSLVYRWNKDLLIGDLCEKGSQLRPHIVWFTEAVPMMEHAVYEISHADAIMIVGTSMQVYPAASLTSYAPPKIPIVYADPDPKINHELSRSKNLKIFKGPATVEVEKALEYLQQVLYQKV